MKSRSVILCAACLIATAASSSAEVREIRYAGLLSQSGRDGEDLLLRRFEVLALVQGRELFFNVLDDQREGVPWPESYGLFGATDASAPHVQYRYDGSPYTIMLPPLRLDLPDRLNEDSEWQVGDWTFSSAEPNQNEKPTVWTLRGSERRGRKQTVAVDAISGLMINATLDVFMGLGEKFKLTLTQQSSAALPSGISEQMAQVQPELLSLQAVLARRPDSQQASLSARQITETVSRLDKLSVLAKATPLQELVLRIRSDVERQQQKMDSEKVRREQLIGSAAPKISLKLVTGGTLDVDAGSTGPVVLHFWDYAQKPLTEPYGQVGYLEFIAGRFKASRVSVIGVATRDMKRQAGNPASDQREARKLIEFMNLSYPVGYDNGALLEWLGTSREAAVELPIWVVVSAAGKVIHFHSGYFEVDRREGLKELSDVLRGQILSSEEKK